MAFLVGAMCRMNGTAGRRPKQSKVLARYISQYISQYTLTYNIGRFIGLGIGRKRKKRKVCWFRTVLNLQPDSLAQPHGFTDWYVFVSLFPDAILAFGCSVMSCSTLLTTQVSVLVWVGGQIFTGLHESPNKASTTVMAILVNTVVIAVSGLPIMYLNQKAI